VRSRTRGREGVWAKIQNRAVVARFRTRRVKRGWEVLCGRGSAVGAYKVVVGSRSLAKRRQGGGLRRNPKSSCVARFRARRVKGRQGFGCVVVMRWRVRGWWWWWWVVRSRNARRGASGPKNRNRAARGSVSGCSGTAKGGEGAVWLQPPLPLH